MSPLTLLNLIWLASPALPIGGFSYSEGLEAAVDAGLVRDEGEARGWLGDQLALALAECDLPAIAEAHRAWSGHDVHRLERLNAWVLTTRESSEFRRQVEQMGRSMLEWIRNGAGDPRVDVLAALRPGPSHPVAFALAAVLAGASERDTLLAYGFGWAENMVQAAMKAVPLGQGAGQRILATLSQALPAEVEHALSLTEDDRQAFAPMLAILSCRHETQYSRLFRS